MNWLLSCIWGFSVGFVCWYGCFSMIVPLSNYLTGKHAPPALRYIIRGIVCVFGIFSVTMLLGFESMVFFGGKLMNGKPVDAALIEMKAMFPKVFLSSLAGLALLLVFRRIDAKASKKEK